MSAFALPVRGVQAMLAGAAIGLCLVGYGALRLARPAPEPAPSVEPATPVLAPVLAPPPVQPGLAARVPAGRRAFSVQASDEIAVAGLVQPGDRVDVQTVLPATVLASAQPGQGEASTLIQDALVLAVNAQLDPAPSGKGGEAAPLRTLTLALTPQEISALSLARSLGAFYLSLRNPGDRAAETAAHARLGDLRAAPAPVVRRRARPAPEAAGVELVIAGESRILQAGPSR